MLRHQPTLKMIEQWKSVYFKFKDKLKPNRKTGQELIDYLKAKYDLIQFENEKANEIVTGNVINNEPFFKKLAKGEIPHPVTFYWKQGKNKVFIGIDLSSGMYHVENDENLWDELCAFQGLDEDDLKNYYCVAEYISCLKKFGKLEDTLNSFK